MNRFVKAQLALEEARKALGELLDVEQRDADYGTKLEAAKKLVEEKRLEVVAAAAAELDENERRTATETAEGREISQLQQRDSLMDFVEETEGRVIQGASAEYRSAMLGEGHLGYVPLEMFGLEYRVDAVSNIATAIQENQRPIEPRVFARPAIEYLGVSSPSVPVGTQTFPKLSGGTTADVRSDGVELDGTAATIAQESVNPVRLTASYAFGVETLSRIAGFEEALRNDVRAVLNDKRDFLALNGQAAVADTSPAVEGIINQLTDPTNPTTVVGWADVLAAYDESVDGKYASDAEQVRLLVNAAAYRKIMGLGIGNNQNGGLLRNRLPASRFRVSANMPASTNSPANIATYLAYAAGAPGRGFVMPTWAGVQLISDPYTLAKKGQRLLTAIMMTGFLMVDIGGYRRGEHKLA